MVPSPTILSSPPDYSLSGVNELTGFGVRSLSEQVWLLPGVKTLADRHRAPSQYLEAYRKDRNL